jgi:hypothetical protein
MKRLVGIAPRVVEAVFVIQCDSAPGLSRRIYPSIVIVPSTQTFNELHGGGRCLVVDRLHPFFGERARVLFSHWRSLCLPPAVPL